MSQEQPSNQIPENRLSQAQLVVLLQQTIAQLDRIVQQLSLDSVETLPPKATVESLVSAAEAIASVLNSPIPSTLPNAEIRVGEDFTLTEPEAEAMEADRKGIDRVLPSFNRLESWWDRVLAKIRSILPVSLSEKLSDWAITSILAGTVVTVLLVSVLLFPQSPTEIAQKPNQLPQPKIIETPPELIAPKPPQTVEIVPPPEPELTPEQSLIAAIQQEVTNLTSQYPAGLIASIEANFPGSRLMVTVDDQWYQLNAKRQDAIGNAILKRSQKLDFRKLEMLDPQGTLIARSPVVGDEIIIVQRQI